MNIKDIVEKAEAYDAVMESLKNQPIQVYKDENIHLKGYMFDSLVYRYKLARHRMTELEIEENRTATHPHKMSFFLQNEERDVMRFIQILDEAIGEHD